MPRAALAAALVLAAWRRLCPLPPLTGRGRGASEATSSRLRHNAATVFAGRVAAGRHRRAIVSGAPSPVRRRSAGSSLSLPRAAAESAAAVTAASEPAILAAATESTAAAV